MNSVDNNEFMVLCYLDTLGGMVIGRKKFHKLLYILRKLGLDIEIPYGFGLYGPYSYYLEEIIQVLSNKGYIEFMYSRDSKYISIKLSEEGRKLLESLK